MRFTGFRAAALAATALSSCLMGAAVAQETDDPVRVGEGADNDDMTMDRVMVTGSRLRRDEFTAISPLQVLDAEEGRAVGLFEIGDLIAQSPTITGVQFDSSTNAGSPTAAVEGVSEGGVGSNNIALRGLAPRTRCSSSTAAGSAARACAARRSRPT